MPPFPGTESSGADLCLADGPALPVLPPDVPIAEALRRNSEAIRWFPQSLPSAAERLATKCHVPFEV